MDQEILQEIREKIDIVEFISNYVELKKTGNYYKGLCPFHQERNPSFFISPQKQIFKCFGCNVAGDVITFYMKIEGLSFKEAIKNLADKFNIEINFKEQKENISVYKKFLEINRLALNFFKRNLQQNQEVINYLKSRGLTEETINFFDLGYASSGSHLRDYFFTLGYKLEDLKEVGLLNDKFEDKFQGRIMFPLINEKRKLIGFTGRLYPETDYGSKYLNTAENKLFKKSKFLYGLVYSQAEIEKKKEVIIIEGQFDFLLAYQNGIKNVVAVSGSAFTQDQLNILKFLTKNFVLAFDNDLAGFKSAWKTALMLFANKIEVDQLIFEPAKDLAEFFNSNYSINQLKKKAYLDYLIDYCSSHFNLEDLDGKKQTLDLILPLLKYLDNLKQGYYLSRLSKILEIKEEFLFKELNSLVYNYQIENEYQPLVYPKDRLEILIERYIAFSFLLNNLEKIEEIKDYLENYNEVKEKLLQDDYYQEILNLRINYESNLNINFEEELRFLKKEIQKEYYKKQIESYSKISGLPLDEVLKKINYLTQKIKEIEKINNA